MLVGSSAFGSSLTDSLVTDSLVTDSMVTDSMVTDSMVTDSSVFGLEELDESGWPQLMTTRHAKLDGFFDAPIQST
jgi:hypothetical protein